MNISRFFIDRPIFAGVISVFITLIGRSMKKREMFI